MDSSCNDLSQIPLLEKWAVTELQDRNAHLRNLGDERVVLHHLAFFILIAEVDRSKERMMEILEERGLSFMFPLLRVQSELWRQIQIEPSATAVFKWIKEKVNEDLHHTSGFINILTTR